MSDTRSPAQDTTSSPTDPAQRQTSTGMVGLLALAAALMWLIGFFQAIAGMAAIFNGHSYTIPTARLLLVHSYTAWGWVHLILGVLIFVAGIGVLSGNRLARGVGIALAALSAVDALAFANAAPVWAIVVIAVDVLVIYALAVHGGVMRKE